MAAPRADRRGAAALEFALCALPLLLVLTAMLEFGWQLAINAGLEYGARHAARLGVTGTSLGAGTPQQALTRAVLRQVPLLQAARFTLELRYWGDLASIGNAAKATSGMGAGGAVVEYRLGYSAPLLTPLGRAGWGKTIEHRAVVVVQNENYL
ncbi:TadE/TadG family type IV pilus assembly protein [Roseomonas sp. 18066]|uniref:TadE/TadG family type IV pilus assembly protein n=1 Tax=Roseomonas sp. 18066 TaxID=2681412 RepID=UPI001356DCD7|nr:TadE/TadG family type IV pilus assembly protein [Roseomonas sp. 18066]